MTEQKGRLELMMDEFTDVHGTVLLGMHKELQTLKQDVAKLVDEKIGQFHNSVTAADSHYQKLLSESQETCKQLEQVRMQTANDVALAHSSAIASINNAVKAGRSDLITLQTSGIHELNVLLDNVTSQRKELTNDLSKATAAIANMIQEHQVRLDATIKVARQLNQEGQATQAITQTMMNDLAKRELAYQRRIRNTMISIAVVCTITIGVWVWLVQRL
jgi:hypothetical protein